MNGSTFRRLAALGAISAALVGTAVTESDADTVHGSPAVVMVAPCEYDDGANAPCVWDAAHRGNGAGRSFVAESDGSAVYVSDDEAARIAARWTAAHGFDR